MLTCRELTEQATDYLEGDLPLTRRVAVRTHLMLCRMCRNHLGQLRRTVALLGETKLPAPPEERVEDMAKGPR